MSRSAAPASSGGRPARGTDDARLDAFAARAAHALGAGIGVAGGYATLLEERHAAALGADGLAALAALDAGLGRVRLFVDDLLELSALGHAPLNRVPQRPTAAARAAAEGLEAPLRDADVELDIATLPDVVADGALLERLFHHLLRSALAGIGEGPGRITISGVRRAAGTRIEVADDGPGLDLATARAMFDPFGAPRGNAPIVGAGVSLAICRRIAERHGGSIWAHSGRRDGCTIVVVLPEDA
jgi:light-regulated signal transduction histidine kinase (bacteriophytochrome)